jgi:Predicted nucleotidyltransferase.
MSLIQRLAQDGQLTAPAHLLGCPLYEVVMGSWAFGTASEKSDHDVYGFFVSGPETPGSEPVLAEFRAINLVAQTAIFAGQADGERDLDIVLYPLATFFERLKAGKSQSLETLFVDDGNVITTCQAARLLQEKRHQFLSKGTARAFQEFAQQQLDGMVSRRFAVERKATIDAFGFDVKAAYHSVRLMNEARQLLATGTLDLRASRDMLLEIRKGSWTEEKVLAYCQDVAAELSSLYAGSSLPEQLNESELQSLLSAIKEGGA